MVNQRKIEAKLDIIRAVLEMEALRTVKEVQWLTGRIIALDCFVSKTTNRCLPFFKVFKTMSRFDWTPECEEVFVRLKDYLNQPPLLFKPQPRKDLYLYLAVSNVAVSAIMI